MDESKKGGHKVSVVKSSHSDVKQAQTEASPQVQKEMKYLFDLTHPQTASFPSILPITRFINVIL